MSPARRAGAAARDAVQVWLVPDQRSEAVLAHLFAVLDAGERLRADAYLSADDRRRFVVAHGAARHIVSRCVGAPAGELYWERGAHGKPELAGRWTGVRANLSHSGEVSMVAVTAARGIGVDVQRVLPHVDTVAMADRYFPSEEADLVRAAPDARSRAELFARLWGRKEALVKAHGGRLTPGLRIPVHDLGAVPGHRIADLPAPRGYRAAVALVGAAGYRVAWHRWTWPGPASGVRGEPTNRRLIDLTT
jgi:4'-phosphopantetheinyl transferase